MRNKYNWIDYFENGFAKVQLNGKWGIINKTGKEVIELKYDKIYYFKNGFFKARLNDEYFWINQDGIKIKEYNENN